ncbi:sensor histidine kinase [Sinanaerobacter chloroacetimidivorans]|uniref:histidine kinase n=1 Tax=Sinanaerobacter chloroacetimidivorans TaxID=2818044 RepID=A0A8J8B3L7_9FIRM|nr:HAMP domain-containing sensor histidine kinase [Sinanaerobacter chloroacetimidivorans]MBR0598450.1 HAMP domain-containing histidine kinase [Sinanaerobacter chloroacetimidivorans]
MRITTKINLLTTAWIVGLLVVINIIVFFLFMETMIHMEQNNIFDKADQITKEIEKDQISNDLDKILNNSLVEDSFIRIILPGNRVMTEVTNDKILSQKIKAKYVNTKNIKTRVIAGQKGEVQVLVANVPIRLGNQGVICLQISERLLGLELRREILRVILISSTIFAAVLSLIGGRWLSNLIMKPVFNMISTMDRIEKSGSMVKIDMQKDTKDELYTMVMTFNKMIDRLQGNMEKQKQFVSDASHEFKTPLTVIKSYANLLQRQGFQDEIMARDAVQTIHLETTRIQKMTEAFLDLANLDNSIVLNETDLVALCQSTADQLQSVYKREINLSFSYSPLIVSVDELRIKQVIVILLDNALKYSADKIDCFIEKNDENIIIGIKDYGIGIPQEELGNIFERFYRVDKARNRETGGSGLGLHIAESIVKLHNGKIEITSNEGSGTLARIILPI